MQRIFVGDVQGCADEFDEILERADREFGRRFELWVVGDAINRGPSNLRVLHRLRELAEVGRAHYVLGNHELAFLATALGLRSPSTRDTFTDLLESAQLDDWVDWLLTRPLVQTGTLGRQPFAMVHAASHPRWSLEELVRRGARVQRELSRGREPARAWLAKNREGGSRDAMRRITNCRSVRGEHWSSALPEGDFVPWHEAWRRENHGYGVVYGHWALQGLHVDAGLRGLDSGCVHHRRSGDRWLTAWLPDSRRERPFDLPDAGFWRIPARRAYYPAADD